MKSKINNYFWSDRYIVTTSEFDDTISKSIIVRANFPVKNDIIKTSVEYVIGVEKYVDYSFSKYEGTISIGVMFDIETIMEQVEEKIKSCLSD